MCCSPSVVGLTAKVDRRKVPNPNLLRAILYSSKYTNINHRPLTEFSLLSLFVLEAMEAHVKLCKAKASCLANHNDRSRWRVRVFLHLYGMRLRKCENAHAVGPWLCLPIINSRRKLAWKVTAGNIDLSIVLCGSKYRKAQNSPQPDRVTVPARQGKNDVHRKVSRKKHLPAASAFFPVTHPKKNKNELTQWSLPANITCWFR